MEPVALLCDGATATFVRAKPNVGSQPSAGGTLVGIMGPLHFGNFAGLLSKAIWFGLGFAMCYVTYTGMRLWVVGRRKDLRSLAWLERTLTVAGYGLPLGLAASAAGFLVAMPLGSAVYWTTAAFLIASAAAIVGGIVAPSNEALTRMLKVATGWHGRGRRVGWPFGPPRADPAGGGHGPSDGAILSPMPGRILGVDVEEGAVVAKGERLLVLEAMMMEQALLVPFDGVVAELHAVAGAQVPEGMVLVRIEQKES